MTRTHDIPTETIFAPPEEVHHDSAADIMQESRDSLAMTPVPVTPTGPIEARILPSHGGGSCAVFTVVNAGVPRKVLQNDPMRRTATLLFSAATLLYTSQAGCTAGIAMPWPLNVPLVWTADNELWAYPQAEGTMSVSVLTERWAS
jgi:hypothetical protein